MQLNRADSICRYVGRRIAKARIAQQMTQEGLAELVDIDPRHVQLIEAGQRNLTLGSLVRLANALRVRVDSLVVGHPPRPRSQQGG